MARYFFILAMTPELQAFINHFKDEAALRSAIEGLLSKKDGCQGVRNLHGMDERGKDLIFYAPAGLGRPKLNACVIKLDKISGSASDAASGARNVLIQCDQALDTPIINTQGHEEWVTYVYVMCPNELSPTAMDSIAGAFKGKPSQIEFICGHDLYQMFKQRWPDFIFFQPDLLSAHLATLAKELEEDVNIRRLATAQGLSALTNRKSIYVEPSLFQIRAALSRKAQLLEHSEVSRISSQRGLNLLRDTIIETEASLQVVDYLPPMYSDKRQVTQAALHEWPKRLANEWRREYEAVSREIFKKDRNAPVPPVHIPKRTVDDFFKSDAHSFVANVYSELDRELNDANTSVDLEQSSSQVLAHKYFPNYGSLLYASTVLTPTIKSDSTGIVEWTADDLLANNQNILITGAPGYGKTSFSRNHFLSDLENFRIGHSKVVPLYFVAHAVEISDGQTFEDVFVRREVGDRLHSEPSLRVRIYLDGLDEVRSKDERDKILMFVRNACLADDTRYHCIATARDHVGGYWTNWLARVRLNAMSKERVRELVTAWLDGDSDLIAQFYSELAGSEALVPVLGVPLLATLTVLVFKNLHRLPENKVRLYQMFIDLLLGGWNLAKGLKRQSQFSSTSKHMVLTRLAGAMHLGRVTESTDSLISSTLKQVAPALVPEQSRLVSELVEDGLLLLTGRLSYTFPHLSFQEYLAAKDATDSSRREQEKRVMQAYFGGDDWYKEVATFIVLLTNNPMAMRGRLVDWSKRFRARGRVSDAEKRVGHLLDRLNDAFPESKPGPIRK